MAILVSVIICTHNPRSDYLAETLASIRCQMCGKEFDWELLLIDNASSVPLANSVDLSRHPGARIITEAKLGLSYARMRSYREARGEILLFVDDDNVLDRDYLAQMVAAFEDDSTLGAIGGKAIARYEQEPPHWFKDLGISLACRDLGDAPLIGVWGDPKSSSRVYPDFAPNGAGMGLRRAALSEYVDSVEKNPSRMALGRRGTDLASGEDNDIVMALLETGWRVAYLPQLRLVHLIPASRLTKEYLERYIFSSNRTWVRVLDLHDLRPWSSVSRWTTPLRKTKAYFYQRAWASTANHLRWRSACGLIEGRASIVGKRL